MSLGPGCSVARTLEGAGSQTPRCRCHCSDDVLDAVLSFVKVPEHWMMDSHSAFSRCTATKEEFARKEAGTAKYRGGGRRLGKLIGKLQLPKVFCSLEGSGLEVSGAWSVQRSCKLHTALNTLRSKE